MAFDRGCRNSPSTASVTFLLPLSLSFRHLPSPALSLRPIGLARLGTIGFNGGIAVAADVCLFLMIFTMLLPRSLWRLGRRSMWTGGDEGGESEAGVGVVGRSPPTTKRSPSNRTIIKPGITEGFR